MRQGPRSDFPAGLFRCRWVRLGGEQFRSGCFWQRDAVVFHRHLQHCARYQIQACTILKQLLVLLSSVRAIAYSAARCAVLGLGLWRACQQGEWAPLKNCELAGIAPPGLFVAQFTAATLAYPSQSQNQAVLALTTRRRRRPRAFHGPFRKSVTPKLNETGSKQGSGAIFYRGYTNLKEATPGCRLRCGPIPWSWSWG